MPETMSTKQGILNAIANTNDTNLKTVLLLMLNMTEEIGSKIDRIYTNKALLRDTVLNGHADVHHDDHEWISERRKTDVEHKVFKERCDAIAAWAEAKMKAEEQAKETVKKGVTEIVVFVASRLVWVVIGMLAYNLPMIQNLIK